VKCQWCGNIIFDSYWSIGKKGVFCGQKCIREFKEKTGYGRDEVLERIQAEAAEAMERLRRNNEEFAEQRARGDAYIAAEKERFRPIIEARLGRQFDHVVSHERLGIWVAEEELLKEQKAVIEDMQKYIKFDIKSLIDCPPADASTPISDVPGYRTWNFKPKYGSIGYLELYNPGSFAPYAAVCSHLGKSPSEIQWEHRSSYYYKYSYDDNFIYMPDGNVADQRLAIKKLFDQVKKGDTGVSFDGTKDYKTWTGCFWRMVGLIKKETKKIEVDVSQYITIIPVDWSPFKPYRFDYTPWDDYFAGKSAPKAPEKPKPEPAAAPKAEAKPAKKPKPKPPPPPITTIFCGDCGSKNSSNDKFCGDCGGKLD